MTDFKELPIISNSVDLHNPNSQDPIIGIDLGTTNSLVSIIENGKPVIIPLNDQTSLLPSVIHFDEHGKYTVGITAKKNKILDAEHTIYSVKRLLGKNSEQLKELLKYMPFTVHEVSPENIELVIYGNKITPIEISAYLLKELKSAAEAHLNKPVEDAVITVPAYFNDSQRQATRAAGKLAGLNVLRILNEPTAAALAYGLHYKKNGTIAVYDLGGGTFDISILKLHNGIFEVLATHGDTQLGGDDIDQLIADWICSTLQISQQELSSINKEDKALLLETAEQLKIQLSQKDTAQLEFRGHSLTLSQSEFNQIVSPILERTKAPILACIQDAKIALQDLTDVVLVGGPTRLPVIQSFVEKIFGLTPNTSLHPDEVVAQGAAIQADILAGNNQDFLLLDVVPLSLGIETFGGAMNKIIPRNTRIPIIAKEQFTTFTDGQTKVAINVFQGERELVRDNRKLSEFVLQNIPPLPAGVARIETSFLVDADGILNISAKELYSGVEQSIEVKPTYGLTDAAVEKMLSDGLNYAQQDAYLKQVLEAKNNAHIILTASEKGLMQIDQQISPEEQGKIKALIESLKLAVTTENLEQIQDAYQALNKGTTRLAELLMKKTVNNDIKNQKASLFLKDYKG